MQRTGWRRSQQQAALNLSHISEHKLRTEPHSSIFAYPKAGQGNCLRIALSIAPPTFFIKSGE